MGIEPLFAGRPCSLTRRRFLWLLSASAAGAAVSCATSPVTGRPQLMLFSEDQEIQIDRQYARDAVASLAVADVRPAGDRAGP